MFPIAGLERYVARWRVHGREVLDLLAERFRIFDAVGDPQFARLELRCQIRKQIHLAAPVAAVSVLGVTIASGDRDAGEIDLPFPEHRADNIAKAVVSAACFGNNMRDFASFPDCRRSQRDSIEFTIHHRLATQWTNAVLVHRKYDAIHSGTLLR